MADLFSELMKSVDTLTDEQVNELLSKLEVKRSGNQKVQEQSKDEEIPRACPHCGSIDLKKHGTKNNRQRYRCKDCGKTFTESTNTLQYIFFHKKMQGKQ